MVALTGSDSLALVVALTGVPAPMPYVALLSGRRRCSRSSAYRQVADATPSGWRS